MPNNMETQHKHMKQVEHVYWIVNLFLFYLYMYQLHAFYTINVCNDLTVMTHNWNV